MKYPLKNLQKQRYAVDNTIQGLNKNLNSNFLIGQATPSSASSLQVLVFFLCSQQMTCLGLAHQANGNERFFASEINLLVILPDDCAARFETSLRYSEQLLIIACYVTLGLFSPSNDFGQLLLSPDKYMQLMRILDRVFPTFTCTCTQHVKRYFIPVTSVFQSSYHLDIISQITCQDNSLI